MMRLRGPDALPSPLLRSRSLRSTLTAATLEAIGARLSHRPRRCGCAGPPAEPADRGRREERHLEPARLSRPPPGSDDVAQEGAAAVQPRGLARPARLVPLAIPDGRPRARRVVTGVQ